MNKNKRIISYQVDPRYFKDGDYDGAGDFKGLANNIEYFVHLGVNTLILRNVINVGTDDETQNFTEVREGIGSTNDLMRLISLGELYKINILVEMPIGFINENHSWFKSTKHQNNDEFTEIVKVFSQKKVDEDKTIDESKLEKLESIDGYFVHDKETREIPLNWKSEQVLYNFSKVIKFWNNLGIKGFVFKNFEYLTDEHRNDFMNYATRKELRKIYREVKEINNKLIVIGSSRDILVESADEYTDGASMIFDYFISEKPPLVGTHRKFGTDKIGRFWTFELVNVIKKLRNKNSILTFGSEVTGRLNSRWGNHGEYWEESAKSLAILQFLIGSSVSIFSGEEIGTLNIGLTHLDDFQDPTLELRKKAAIAHRMKEKDFMDAQVLFNPINSRSVMSWNDERNGGFTPIKEMNGMLPFTYRSINVTKQFKNNASVLSFYRALIVWSTRTSAGKIINNGKWKISSYIPGLIKIVSQLGEKEVIAYINLTDKNKRIRSVKEGKVVLSSYPYKKYKQVPVSLFAYESIIILKRTDEVIKNTQLIELSKLKATEINRGARKSAATKKTTPAKKVTKTQTIKAPAKKVAKTQTIKAPAKVTKTQTIKAPAKKVTKTQTIKAPAKVTKTQTIKAPAKVTKTQTIKAPAKVTKTQTIKAPVKKVTKTQTIKAPAKVTKTQTIKAPTKVTKTQTIKAPAKKVTKTQTIKAPAKVTKTQTIKAPTKVTKTQTIKAPVKKVTKTQDIKVAPEKIVKTQTIKTAPKENIDDKEKLLEEKRIVKEQEKTVEFEMRQIILEEKQRQKEEIQKLKELEKQEHEKMIQEREMIRTKELELREKDRKEKELQHTKMLELREKNIQEKKAKRLKEKEEKKLAKQKARKEKLEQKQKAKDAKLIQKKKDEEARLEKKQKEAIKKATEDKKKKSQEKKEAKKKANDDEDKIMSIEYTEDEISKLLESEIASTTQLDLQESSELDAIIAHAKRKNKKK